MYMYFRERESIYLAKDFNSENTFTIFTLQIL